MKCTGCRTTYNDLSPDQGAAKARSWTGLHLVPVMEVHGLCPHCQPKPPLFRDVPDGSGEAARLRKHTFYLAGPMSGIPGANYPLFSSTTKGLRSRGLRIITPSENFMGRREGIPRPAFLRRDYHNILQRANAMLFLPDWALSEGATGEFLLARSIDYPMFQIPRGMDTANPAGIYPLDLNKYPPATMERLRRTAC